MAGNSPQVDEQIYLLEPLLSIKVRNEKFQLLIKACKEQQTLACKSEAKLKSVVSTVNARLNEFQHRSSGIQLLKILLAQCSDIVFVENSVSWMMQCIRAATNQQSADEAYEVLYLLIEMSHNFQELTKSVSGQIVPKLIDQLLTVKKSYAALQCLEAVLHYYPGPCKVKVKVVEMYLLMFVDEQDQTLVKYASRCFCYLPLLLTTGKNDGRAWTDGLTELCATASSLMFELFENIHETTVPPALAELPVGYKLKSLKIDSPFLSLHHIATRIINIFTFIEGMLLGDLANVKAVRDDLLIALAYRALAINCNMVSRGKTMEHVALVCVLPNIHGAAFHLLQTLVSCCDGGLLKYGPLFCKLVLQTLKCTQLPCGYGVERPFSHLREVAYKFLTSWVTRAKAASCVELVCEELITIMLQDVYHKKESVTLQFQEKGKNTSQQQLPQIRQQLVNPEVNYGSCAAALRALSAIIESSGALLGPTLHMQLQEVVVTLLLEIKLCSGPKEMPVPYSEAGCRMQLFRLLLALTLHPHPRWPPPTQFSLALFSWGRNDCSLKVAGFCSLAVACTRQMVHPSQSSHQFPISVDEMRSSVGLPNLEVVRGCNLAMQNGQNNITTESSLELKTSNLEKSQQSALSKKSILKISTPEKSRQTPLPKNSVENNIFQSSNSDKPSKKKPRISFNETSLNGIESRSNTSIDATKPSKKKRQLDLRPTTVSDKHSKKLQHLQFTVQEVANSAQKTVVSKRGQGWKVTQLMEVKERPTEKKFDKSAKACDTAMGIKRLHNSPKDIDKISKIRKLDDSLMKSDGLINEAPDDNLPDSNIAGNSESIKPNDTVNGTHIDVEHSITINDADINVEPSVKINDTTEKDSSSCVVNEEKTEQEKILGQEKTKEHTGTGVVEAYELENENRERGDSSTKKDSLSNQSPLKSSQEKSNCFTAKDENKVIHSVAKPLAASNCKSKEVDLKSSDVSDCKFKKSKEVNSKSPDAPDCKSKDVNSKSPDVSDCKSKEVNSKSPKVSGSKSKEFSSPKSALPIVELLSSSDSETEQKKSASEAHRRITYSPAKHTSTPHRNSEEQVSIEEVSSSKVTVARGDVRRLEVESVSVNEDPRVELVDSDDDPLVLRIESDRESVDIMDVTNNKVDEASTVKEKNETATLVKQTSPLGNTNSPNSKNLKDSVTSDREIEEVTEEMEAVVDSPDVTVEEVSACSDKENAAKKSAKEIEDGSGSETNEEEILASFVDALQPKSE